jgi:hypothetical protein
MARVGKSAWFLQASGSSLLRGSRLAYTEIGKFSGCPGVKVMPVIRIPATEWGKVWRVLVASGPISRIEQEPVYLVSDQQVRLLRRKKLPFELVSEQDGHKPSPNHG